MKIGTFFEQHPEVAVAFSGGVDSAVVLLLAGQYATRVKAYYVKTAFQPQFELDDAVAVATALGAELAILPLDILSDETIAANPPERCYYCKKRIMGAILAQAQRDGFSCVLDGTNASDDVSDRPGFRALGELGVYSPLRDAGITKAAIREMAAAHQLSVADKPSYACLATRIPHGTLLTESLLTKTETAEDALRAAGMTNFRVRYADGAARLELCREDFEVLFRQRDDLTALLAKDYDGVYLDLKERANE